MDQLKNKKISVLIIFEIVLLLILVFQFILFDRAVMEFLDASKFLNAIAILLVGIYIFVLLSKQKYKYIRPIIFFSIIFATLGVTMLGNISPNIGVKQYLYHDGAAMSDIAYEKLLDGENPYSINYRDTTFGEKYGRLVYDLEGHTIPNPAMEQYIYFPATFLLNGVVNSFEYWIFGFSDARILVLLSFVGIILMLWFIAKKSKFRYLIIILFAFNPIYLLSFFEGRNDILVIFFLVAFLATFIKRRYIFSAIMLGLALSLKQFVWLILPFIIFYFIYSPKDLYSDKKKNLKTLSLVATLIVLIIITPFFIWSPMDFIQDTILYPGGSDLATSYPITGYGLSPLITLFGNKTADSFPFAILAVILILLVGYYFWKKIKKTPSLAMVLIAGALIIFFTSYVSRAMNDNYIAFISQLLIISLAFVKEEDLTE